MALGDTRNWLRQNEISGRASHPPSLIFEWLGKGWEQPRPAVMSKKRNRVGTPESTWRRGTPPTRLSPASGTTAPWAWLTLVAPMLQFW